MAVALLGAITHQPIGAWVPAQRGSDTFIGRARGVSAPAYTHAIIVLYVITASLGAVIYAEYRITARIAIEQMGLTHL